MMNVVIDRLRGDIYTFLMDEDGHTIEIHHEERTACEHVGDLYVGRVKDLVKGLEAAFVDIGTGRNVYLPFDQLVDPHYTKKGSRLRIQQGDELIVQVIREAVKTKAAAVSSQINLRGRYVALRTGSTEKGVSRKIPKPRRAELKEWVNTEGLFQEGVILRTNAANATEEAILTEYAKLSEQMNTLIESAQHKIAPCCLSSDAPWLRHLLDLPQDKVTAIWIEDEELYTLSRRTLTLFHPEMLPCLKRYEDSLQPLTKAWALEERLQEARSRKVWLKSGAYLLIEPTETLTAIDVNTGKQEKKGKAREETFYQVNREAARMIATQLRLRGISGTIIVDFISMEDEEHQKELMAYFHHCLAEDPVPTRLIDMTALGLVEVTRKRGEKPL